MNGIGTQICGFKTGIFDRFYYILPHFLYNQAEYVLGTLQELSTDIPRVFKTPVESVSMADYIDALNGEVLTMHQMLWDIREAMQLPGKAELPEYPDELRPS